MVLSKLMNFKSILHFHVTFQAIKKEEKEKKKRSKKAIVGDLKPMQESINLIDEVLKIDQQQKEKNVNKKIKKSKGGQFKKHFLGIGYWVGLHPLITAQMSKTRYLYD